jgi:hypothetical protein
MEALCLISATLLQPARFTAITHPVCRPHLFEGRLRPDENGGPRTFTRNDGSAGAAFEVTVETIKFLGSPPGSNGAEAPVPIEEDSVPF